MTRLELAILGWFTFQATFFALYSFYAPGISVPPDEVFHFNFAQFYADNSWWPILESQDGLTGDWRDITRPPQYLYHYLASFVIRAQELVGLEGSVVPLRLVSVAISVLNLVVVQKVIAELGFGKTIRVFTIFVLSNLTMWTLLSGSVTYDVPANLISSLSVLYFVRQLKRPGGRNLWAFGMLALVGPLVKFTVLPLQALMALVLLVRYRQKVFTQLLTTAKATRRLNPVLAAGVLLVIVLSAGLFTERYIGNTLEYGSFRPGCDEVHSDEICQQSALYRRNQAFVPVAEDAKLDLATFSTDWVDTSHRRIVGTLTHISSTATFDKLETVTLALAWVSIIGTLSAFALYRSRPITAIVSAIAALYVLLAAVTNYQIYLRSGQFGLALQGRYLFPVLPLLIAIPAFVASEKLSKFKSIDIRWLFAPVALTLAVAGFPAYLVKADERVFEPSIRNTVEAVRDLLISVSSWAS